MPFAIGALIAKRYEVVEQLGVGAMGSVLRVIDRTLDNATVALKLLHPHRVQDEISFARFRNEVLIARELSHPNIVRTYDFGDAGNRYFFISMEYVRGTSLRNRIYSATEPRLTFPEVLAILYEICAGLAHAHQRGIVHRDLKPDNILLTISGEVKITDFGLARTVSLSKGLTETGTAVGTPAYMAPEQIQGDTVDARCDLYALGIIAFELVARRRPFLADDYFTIARKHLVEPVPALSDDVPGVPRWYEAMVERCLAKKREERYASAEELATVLREEMEVEPALVDEELKRRPLVLSMYRAGRERKGAPLSLKMLLFNLSMIAFFPVLFLILVGLTRVSSVVRETGGAAVLQVERMTGVDLAVVKSLIGIDLSLTEDELLRRVGDGDFEATELLLNARMDVNARNDAGQSLLHLGAASENPDLVHLLVERGANVNAVDTNGLTPLMYAARNGNLPIVYELLKRVFSVNARDNRGRTALMHAAIKSEVSIVQALIDRGAYVNLRDKGGETALIHAVRGADLSVVQALLDSKADVNLKDDSEKTPLSYAEERNDPSIVRALLSRGGTVAQVGSTPEAQPTGIAEVTPTLTQEESKLTRLRLRGEPVGDWEKRDTLRLRKISATIANVGDVRATQVRVIAVIPGGREVLLVGPGELERNATARYQLELNESVTSKEKIKVKVSCENCWR